jgi:predicted enzyme related to lactoylglutathione lyase
VWGGAVFNWTNSADKPVDGTTTWSVCAEQSDQFAPSHSSFMINYRVDNLQDLVLALKEEGCNVLDKIDESEYGKFAWVLDPEGNKVELWQAPEGQ